MIQRIALLIGGLGAAAVLAVALGAVNFVFADPNAIKQTAATQPAAAAADVSAAANSSTTDTVGHGGQGQGQDAQTQTKKVVDKVYIAPSPTPKVIVGAQSGANNTQATSAPPAHTRTPAPARSTHDGGGYNDGHDGQQSEHPGGLGHERGDD